MEQRQEIFRVKNDIEADEMLSEIRELQAERSRFEMIFKARMEQLQADFDRRVATIDKEIEFNKSMLQAYFLTVKPKETKTQKSYKLLSGQLVMKKPSKKIEVDKEKLLQYAKENAKEYIKVKEEVAWADMKKNLDIDGDLIINKETGEVMSELQGLTVKEIGEIFDIKL